LCRFFLVCSSSQKWHRSKSSQLNKKWIMLLRVS
jgi:hypothetical protein